MQVGGQPSALARHKCLGGRLQFPSDPDRRPLGQFPPGVGDEHVHRPAVVGVRRPLQQPPLLRAGDLSVVEQRFRDEHLHRCVSIPQDTQLAAMLDSGHYSLDALSRSTRMAIKHLGVAVAEQLV